MKRLVLAVAALVALTINAEAESCSDKKAYCYSVSYAQGIQRCDSYFQACMSTGVWTSRKGTTTGLTKK